MDLTDEETCFSPLEGKYSCDLSGSVAHMNLNLHWSDGRVVYYELWTGHIHNCTNIFNLLTGEHLSGDCELSSACVNHSKFGVG